MVQSKANEKDDLNPHGGLLEDLVLTFRHWPFAPPMEGIRTNGDGNARAWFGVCGLGFAVQGLEVFI